MFALNFLLMAVLTASTAAVEGDRPSFGTLSPSAAPVSREYIWPEDAMPYRQPHQVAEKAEVVNAEGFDPSLHRVPFVEWYVPPDASRTKTCVIFISGGAFQCCCDADRLQPAIDRFVRSGITVANLTYRTPRPKGLPIHQTAWADAQRAVRYVRSNSARFGFSPDRIGATGISAGGKVVLLLALSSNRAAYRRVDPLDDVSCAISFGIVQAPGYVLQDGAEGPNVNGGENSEIVPELEFEGEIPPLCLLQGGADIYSPIGSVRIHQRLEKLGIPSALHLFADRSHGFHGDATRGFSGTAWDHWCDRMLDFTAVFEPGALPPGECGKTACPPYTVLVEQLKKHRLPSVLVCGKNDSVARKTMPEQWLQRRRAGVQSDLHVYASEIGETIRAERTLEFLNHRKVGALDLFPGDWDINSSVSGIRTHEDRLAKARSQSVVFAGDKDEKSARERAAPFADLGHPVYFTDAKSETEVLDLARRLKKQYGVPSKFEVTGAASIPVAAVYRAHQMKEGLFTWVHAVDVPEGFTSEDLICAPVVERAGKAFSRRCVAPAAIAKNAAGNWLVDFGRAAFGWAEVKSSAQIIGAAGEKLTKGNSVDIVPYSAVRGARVYAPSSGADSFRRLTFRTELFSRGRCLSFPRELGEIMPMRYLEIPPGAFTPTPENVRMIALEYPYDETESGFSSDNPVLDDIYELCRYTIRACTFAGMYMDGDRERLPYEADAYVTQLSNYAMSSDYDVSRVTCDYLMPYSTWPTEYRQISVLMNWAYWMWSGRDDLLVKYYDELKNEKLMERFRRDSDGLLETGGEMLRGAYEGAADIADWPPPERHGFEFRKVNAVVNAYYYMGLRQMAQIAAHLGKSDDAAAFRARASQAANSFQKVFFDEKRGIYVDGEGARHASIHANSLAVVAGLVPESRMKSVGEWLAKQEMECSVYFAQHFLEALFKTGHGERAVALMTADNDRSWAGMLKAGATLTKESWNESVSANIDWNHTWGTAAINVITRCLAGVTPAKPGFDSVRIEPNPAGLSRFHAKVPTNKGPVEIRCKRINGHYVYEIRTPVKAEIVIGGSARHVAPGKHVFR